MFGNINPKQIQGMMKKMGIAQMDIAAKRVIIECSDKNIVINNPSVMKVNMQGQESFQISGAVSEESLESFSEEDVKLVIEKTKKSRAEVIKFLSENDGDIAKAILELR
jgi:nascent polypeptide-associated complex subunit alpha